MWRALSKSPQSRMHNLQVSDLALSPTTPWPNANPNTSQILQQIMQTAVSTDKRALPLLSEA